MLTAPPRPARPGHIQAAPASPPTRPPRQIAAWAAAGNDAATAALAFLTLTSLWGFTRVFATHRWVGPVLTTALAAHLVSWAMRRLRMPAVLGAFAGLAAVVLVSSWTLLGRSTAFGVPTGSTFSSAADSMRSAYDQIPSIVAPVQPLTGFVLSAAFAAGALAVAGDWLAFRTRSSLWASLAPFAIFMTACVLGFGPGRSFAVVLEVLGLLGFVLIHRVSVSGSGHPWLAGVREGAAAWALPGGALIAAGAMAAALVATPVSSGVEGSGVLGWHGTGSGGPRQVANPIVDLHTRLVQEDGVRVFMVNSPVPSYWRLTSLDAFTGQAWVSTGSYRGFGDRLPDVVSAPAGTRVVSQHFLIQGLDSVWLPAAFDPLSVTGVHGVGYDPASSSLITPHHTSNGLVYTVTSYQYLSTLVPADLRAAPPVQSDGAMARYLSLPSNIPSSVSQLARKITAGKQTEYDKAVALQDFFHGPTFQYSLDPPDDGYGVDALTTFLFDTRTGYCQQFAGAYAVLARAIGLPTRLAVGFATGTNVGGDNYQVLDADAHTWPEIYFGPKIGWVPFEPTKSFSNPSGSGYAPVFPTGPVAGGPQSVAPELVPKGTAAGVNGPTATTKPTAAPGITARANRSSGLSGGTKGVLVILGAIAGWVIGNAGWRRWRWWFTRWRVRKDPRSAVLARWGEVGEVLAWWGVARKPGDTDGEFAGRAVRSLGPALEDSAIRDGVERLAGLATQAGFAPEVPPGAPREAALVAVKVRQGLLRRASLRKLIKWGLLQRPRRPA